MAGRRNNARFHQLKTNDDDEMVAVARDWLARGQDDEVEAS